MSKPLIVFTGGHHNSALVVAKQLKAKDYPLFWLGHRYTMAGVVNESAEFREVKAAGIPFIELKSGKFHRGNPWQWILILRAFCYSLWLLYRHKAAFVVSFGGYLAVPVVLAAWCLRIRSVTHEQTTVLGLANRFLKPFVQRVWLAWPNESLEREKKVSQIGLPVEPVPHFLTKQELASWLSKEFQTPNGLIHMDKPLLLISGGKQGSHFINRLVAETLEPLLASFWIIHQAGNNSVTKDYDYLQHIRQGLPSELASQYIVIDYSPQFRALLAVADLIIGRSGAHTMYDVLTLKKKMVCIPLPISYANEQYQNAVLLSQLGLGVILKQDQATSSTLQAQALGLHQRTVDYPKIDRYIEKYIRSNAAVEMVKEIEALLP